MNAGTRELVLYRHWGKDGTLLYAGRTNNPPARLGRHRAGSPWWTDVAWTTYQGFGSLDELKEAETRAIQDENPVWNIQGKRYEAPARKSTEPGIDRYLPVTTRDLRPDIRLVHPLSREFSVYGGDDTLRRCREWALRSRYYLLDSGPVCAHAFYLMRCPNAGERCLPYADHTQVWVPAPDFSDFERYSGAASPFILTQPYSGSLPEADVMNLGSAVPAEVTTYAAAHGLDTGSYAADAWYYPGHCTPVRLTPRGREYTAFPLETEALSLMCAWRDSWPEEVPEWLS